LGTIGYVDKKVRKSWICRGNRGGGEGGGLKRGGSSFLSVNACGGRKGVPTIEGNWVGTKKIWWLKRAGTD